MMASFMLYSGKTDLFAAIRRPWRNLIFLLLVMLLSPATLAAEKGHIEIESFHVRKSGESFQIDVEANIDLSRTMKQALKKRSRSLFRHPASDHETTLVLAG